MSYSSSSGGAASTSETMFDAFHRLADCSVLVPLSGAIARITTLDPKSGFARVALELERIETSLRATQSAIEEFLSTYEATCFDGGLSPDESDVMNHLGLTRDDLAFLHDAVNALRQTADSLAECAVACNVDDILLPGLSKAVALAAGRVSEEAIRLHQYEKPVLRILSGMRMERHSVDQRGNVVSSHGAGDQVNPGCTWDE